MLVTSIFLETIYLDLFVSIYVRFCIKYLETFVLEHANAIRHA